MIDIAAPVFDLSGLLTRPHCRLDDLLSL